MLYSVKSLEDRIYCNKLSKQGRQQTVELKRFLEAAATQGQKPLAISFATDLCVVEPCLKTSYATELRCREQSSVAFYQAQQRNISDLWNKVYCDLCLSILDPLWT